MVPALLEQLIDPVAGIDQDQDNHGGFIPDVRVGTETEDLVLREGIPLHRLLPGQDQIVRIVAVQDVLAHGILAELAV